MTDLADRDAKILTRYGQGTLTYAEVADEFGVTEHVVHNAIKLSRKLQPQTGMLRYDAARQALAECRSYDEVRDWEDKAAAVREYARRSRNRGLEIDALEIRARAERRRGELLGEMKASGVLVTGPRKQLVDGERPIGRLTLEDLDTSKDESARAQRLARIEPDAFERLAARCRAHLEADDKAHAFDVLRERDGPVNGARSVMGSRQEPDDSLDYFPTPPWATRALCSIILPRFVSPSSSIVWEPACGEGHMAEVLKEHFGDVWASDIHDYGYGEAVADFLTDHGPDDVDWIITNPPFGDAAEAFVLRAIARATVGVAMFFRLQWLETVGRFERIFKPFPPRVIAQFTERVPLHKGRWEPDGDTATAYLWIVWTKARVPGVGTEFFWIPPGQRETLTKPDDRERFTAHPVLPRGKTVDGETFDPETGEINDEESTGPKVPYGRSLDAGNASTKASSRETEPARTSPALPHSEIAAEVETLPPLPGKSSVDGHGGDRSPSPPLPPPPAQKDAGPIPVFLRRTTAGLKAPANMET